MIDYQNGEMIMQIKDLIMLFDAGSLKKAKVVINPLGFGYNLLIDKYVLEAQRGGERVFKSIDAACESALKIGFKRVEVCL
jgi:hypothetical protein